jgi:hypothetical protein
MDVLIPGARIPPAPLWEIIIRNLDEESGVASYQPIINSR